MKDINANRQYLIQGLMVAGALLLLLTAARLQLFDSKYRTQANVAAIQGIVQYPSRGLVYDRNGKLIVYNKAIYDLKVTFNQVSPSMDTAKFCRLLNIDNNTYNKNLYKDFKNDYRYAPWVPFSFLSNIPAEGIAQFQEHLYEFPGFYLELKNTRGYNYHAGAHVLGYISEINEQQVKNDPEKYYREGDYLGTNGIEKQYEKILRGNRGIKYVMRDNMGRYVGSYREGEFDTTAISGDDLITTLDIELQAYAETLLQNKRGGVVAIEPATGEILAFVSSPTYDPELMTPSRNRGAIYDYLSRDTTKPLFNRPLMAQYPPGSTFKPVLALCALQDTAITPDFGYTCNGGYFYGRRLGCHNHPSASNVVQGVQHSCNAYFCQTFRNYIDMAGADKPQVGYEKLTQRLHDFGLGERLGIDLPNELTGNVPTTQFFNKLYGSGKGGWRSTTIISMGIGQGEWLVTPLQMANYTAAIANKGFYIIPHVAKYFKRGPNFYHIDKYAQQHAVNIDKKWFYPVVEGMEMCVLAGTARIAQIDSISVCGKTGTAENPHGKDHSVFVAFAPKDNPKIVVASFIENAGFGATYAAPIASLMIEKYLKGSITSKKRLDVEKRMKDADLIHGKQPKPSSSTH